MLEQTKLAQVFILDTLKFFTFSWTYVECSFRFLSRFAQENASVAHHENARLPRPPLLLLLAQEPVYTHTYTRTHCFRWHQKGRSGSTALSNAGIAIRVFVKCFYFLIITFLFLLSSDFKRKCRFYILQIENLKDLYCELLPHSWKLKLFQPFFVTMVVIFSL